VYGFGIVNITLKGHDGSARKMALIPDYDKPCHTHVELRGL
jgi:hypothetical protein